jgi:hypothetical protein
MAGLARINAPAARRRRLYNTEMPRLVRLAFSFVLAFGVAAAARAQTPVPFPKPVDPQKPPPKTGAPVQPGTSVAAPGQPTEAALGMPIYPGASFIGSYDAGRGQRYYIFGTNASFADIVSYYRTVLKDRGDLVYDEPPVHMFDVGRFREETMAFPPGVTIKDYTWAGSSGYLSPRPGGQPVRYRTIIQIVPAPRTADR